MIVSGEAQGSLLLGLQSEEWRECQLSVRGCWEQIFHLSRFKVTDSRALPHCGQRGPLDPGLEPETIRAWGACTQTAELCGHKVGTGGRPLSAVADGASSHPRPVRGRMIPP